MMTKRNDASAFMREADLDDRDRRAMRRGALLSATALGAVLTGFGTAHAANECGPGTAGGTVTCSAANYTNGIYYNVGGLTLKLEAPSGGMTVENGTSLYAVRVQGSDGNPIMVEIGKNVAVESVRMPADSYAEAYGIYGSSSVGGVTLSNAGTISVNATGGSATSTGSAYADAFAYGMYGSGDSYGYGSVGDMTLTNAGTISVNATGGSTTSTSFAFAYGMYGSGDSYGSVRDTTLTNAGTISVNATGGSTTSTSFAYADAFAYGMYGSGDSYGSVRDTTLTNTGAINVRVEAGSANGKLGRADAYGMQARTSATSGSSISVGKDASVDVSAVGTTGRTIGIQASVDRYGSASDPITTVADIVIDGSVKVERTKGDAGTISHGILVGATDYANKNSGGSNGTGSGGTAMNDGKSATATITVGASGSVVSVDGIAFGEDYTDGYSGNASPNAVTIDTTLTVAGTVASEASDGTAIDLDRGDDMLMLVGTGTGGAIVRGAIDGGEGTDAFTLTGDEGTTGTLDLTRSAVRGFETFAKTGAGTWSIRGDGTSLGSVSVKAGTLRANGMLGDVSVGASGTLGGSGTIETASVAGTLAPGNSIGTLTATGDVSFKAGSSFDAEIAPDGASDRLVAGGTVSIASDDTTLRVIGDPAKDFPLKQTYTLIEAKGGIKGRFATVTDNLPDLDLKANYEGNKLKVAYEKAAPPIVEPPVVKPEPTVVEAEPPVVTTKAPIVTPKIDKPVTVTPRPAPVTFSNKEMHAASSVSTMMPGTAFASALIDPTIVKSNTGLTKGIGSSFGNGTLGAGSFSMSSKAAASGLLTETFAQGSAVPSTGGLYPADVVALDAAPASRPEPAFVLLGGVLGERLDVEDDGALSGYEADTAGGYVGLGTSTTLGNGNAVASFAVLGGISRTDVDTVGGASQIDAVQLGALATYTNGPLSLAMTGSIGSLDVEGARSIALGGGGTSIALTQTEGWSWSASARASYNVASAFGLATIGDGSAGIRTGGSTPVAYAINPFVSLEGVGARVDGYTETGAGVLNLTVPDAELARATARIGVVASTLFVLDGSTRGAVAIEPSAGIAYERAFGDLGAAGDSSIAFANATFSTPVAELDEDRLIAQAGLTVSTGRVGVSASYEGTFGDRTTIHRGALGLTIGF